LGCRSGRIIIVVAQVIDNGITLRGCDNIFDCRRLGRRRRAQAEKGRQVSGGDQSFRAEDKGVFDDIFQLPDIAGVVVGEQ
jgi:hypothetical protein